jgi:integrase
MSILDKVRTKETYFERISVKSRNTKNAVRTAINSFENFCQKRYHHNSDYVFEQLSKLKGDVKENQIFETLQDFINYLNEQNHTAWTVRLTVLRLKPYLAYRTMTKIHNEDFKAELNFPKNVKERHESLSLETIKKILDYASPERKALYLTLLSSALRIGEAVQLRKRDFEVFGQRLKISVRAKYTKTKQERITFISKEAEAYVRPILDRMSPDKLVFGTNEESFQAMQNEETYFLRLRQKAGFDEKYDSGVNKVTIHALRSYFITKCEKIHEGFGHALAGHDRYMKEYERFSDQELLEFYLKAEPELTISDEERLLLQNKIKDETIDRLQSENTNKISELEENTKNLTKRIEELQFGKKARYGAFTNNMFNYTIKDDDTGQALSIIFYLWFEMRATEEEKRQILKRLQQSKENGGEIDISMLGESKDLSFTNLFDRPVRVEWHNNGESNHSKIA